MRLGELYTRLRPWLLFLVVISPCHADTVRDAVPERDAEHQRGVALAREGRYADGLAVLTALHRKYPGYYPIERDIVIVTTWKGECRRAVARFEPLREHPDLEPYLIIPVSECLMKIGRPREALALLDQGQRRWPADTALAAAYAEAQARGDVAFRNDLRLEVSTNTSDQGKREWFWGATAGRRLADRTRAYVRYRNARSGFEEYQSGKQDRVGIGLEHEFKGNVVFTQEFSDDARRDGQNGRYTSVIFIPDDSWRVGASYTSFAEDLPLRAKAQQIEAKQSVVFTDYHSTKYLWSWAASASRYDFSDTNRRSTLFTSLGYAYEQQPKREQRVFLELYRSDNTLANTVYFNPSHDTSISVVHRTDFVFDTRFRRHVDHLTLSLGQYEQQGFAARGIWGVRYEQDYDFTRRTALLVGAGYARRVYDGASEYETSVHAVFRWLF